METETILECHDLVRSFGGFRAVDGVSFAVRRGTIHSLIGPNGAGKTTFFNLLTKFLSPTSGRIVFKGSDITRDSPSRIARRGIVRSFQISAVFPTLTVHENVRIAVQGRQGSVFSFWRSDRGLRKFNERTDELLEMVGLQAYRSVNAGQLPYGRKRTLEVATTLALDPEMILLDEPMAGMGREDIDRMSDLIRSVSANRTVLMVEHNLSVVAQLSDRISVLARGKLLADGSYEEVSKDPRVIEAYIGASE